MKVLILSCNTGEGHNTAGNAILEEFKSRNIECIMLDALLFFGKRTSRAVSSFYKNISVKTPSLFGFMYKMSLKMSTKKFKSLMYYANKPSARRLYGYILENDIDTIILTHLFPAETVTGISINNDFGFAKFYFIATDYTCYPFCEDISPELFFIPHHSLTSKFTDRGINKESIYSTGIPVSQKFRKSYDKIELCKELGLNINHKKFLIMTGSMGNGNLKYIINPLLKKMQKNDLIIVLGGNNQQLKDYLRKKYKKYPQISILDYTNQVEKYMAACDIIFTKPGGLSSTEAAVIGIPIIHTQPIPGCETDNIEFFSNHGLSIYEENSEKMIEKAFCLLKDKKRVDSMIKRQSQYINKNSAINICDIIIERNT